MEQKIVTTLDVYHAPLEVQVYKFITSGDQLLSMSSLKVLGVGSSYNQASFGTKTLKILLSKMKTYDAETHLLDLREVDLPIFNSGSFEEPASLKIQKTGEKVNWADAFVLVSPDYHGSMSGSMKNFLDYYWEEFAGKTFGYVCTSHEKGLTVMDQMRTAVRQCYGWSLPYGISVNAEEDFNESGNIANDLLAKRLNILARDLVVYGKLIRNQFIQDLKSEIVDTFAARYRT